MIEVTEPVEVAAAIAKCARDWNRKGTTVVFRDAKGRDFAIDSVALSMDSGHNHPLVIMREREPHYLQRGVDGNPDCHCGHCQVHRRRTKDR